MLFERFLRKKTLMAALALTAAVPSVAKASMLSAAPTADGENQKLKPGVYYIVMTSVKKVLIFMSLSMMKAPCMGSIIAVHQPTSLISFYYMLRTAGTPFRV